MSEATAYHAALIASAPQIFSSAKLPEKLLELEASEIDIVGWESQIASGIDVGTGSSVFSTPTPGWYSLGFSIAYKGQSRFLGKNVTLRIKKDDVLLHTLRDRLPETYEGTFGGNFLIEMGPNEKISFTISFQGNIKHNYSGMASLVRVESS